MRSVLVCLDRSELGERALPHALAIACLWEARLTLLHVMESRRGSMEPQPPDALDWEILRAESREYLERICARAAAHGLEAEVRLVEGQAAQQILHELEDRSFDLTVVASHGERGLSCWSLSSTASKVVARATGSVLVVPARAGPADRDLECRYRRVMTPLDGSLRAECALPVALQVAKEHRAELILAHVVPTPELISPKPLSTEDRELAHQLVARNERVAEAYLSGMQERLVGQGVRSRVVMRREADVRVIPEICVSEGVDLLVLSAHGNTGSNSCRYGSTTECLFALGTVPLLVVQDLSASEIVRFTKASEVEQEPVRLAGLYHDELP